MEKSETQDRRSDLEAYLVYALEGEDGLVLPGCEHQHDAVSWEIELLDAVLAAEQAEATVNASANAVALRHEELELALIQG